jgi:hypothetical protein
MIRDLVGVVAQDLVSVNRRVWKERLWLTISVPRRGVNAYHHPRDYFQSGRWVASFRGHVLSRVACALLQTHARSKYQ